MESKAKIPIQCANHECKKTINVSVELFDVTDRVARVQSTRFENSVFCKYCGTSNVFDVVIYGMTS